MNTIVSSIMRGVDPDATDVMFGAVGLVASIAGVDVASGEVVNAALELIPSVSTTLIAIWSDSVLSRSPSEIV